MESERPESAQSSGFVKESARFVETHIADYPAAPEWLLTMPRLRESTIRTVLDVGCGPANFLMSVVDKLGCDRGFGVEPSPKAVDLLNAKFADDPRLEFSAASAHELPFESDSIDLVICWSVLHWVGRNEYLQALGELVRVTRRYLIVMDFSALRDYRVPYRHDDRFFTYKSDFVAPILASGVMRLSEDLRWWDGGAPGGMVEIDANELEPFVGNPLSFHARRGCVFEKDYDGLPLHTERDFAREVRANRDL